MTFNTDGESKSIVQSEVWAQPIFIIQKKTLYNFQTHKAFNPSSKLLCDKPWNIGVK